MVVAPLLFSDVPSEAASASPPSANRNPDDPSVPGMYEPVHGTAPDIVGEDVANPLATLLSGALMFDDLGEPAAADALRRAVGAQVREPDAALTPDLGGQGTTEGVAGEVAAWIRDGGD